MRELTIRDAINEAMREEMERDERVFLLGEDVGAFGGAFKVSKGLYEAFGARRVVDTPISEAAIVGTALGAAMTGLRPVAEIMFVDFTTVAMDQITNQVAKARYMLGGQVKVPLVIRMTCGASGGWAAQHSQSLEPWFLYVPGLKVVTPATAADAKGLLKTAIRDDSPVLFMEHKRLYNRKGLVPDGEYTIPLGQAEVKRPGQDVTLVTYSYMVYTTLEAAERLADEMNIQAEVIDLRTLNPMDMETVITSVKKTGRLVVVHEGHTSFGVGAEITGRVVEQAFDHLDAPVQRVGAVDTPIPYSPALEHVVIPDAARIVTAVRRLWDGQS
jgi:pyruvate/2-oxoglutarate/acetoin dehydrogenase E1 component